MAQRVCLLLCRGQGTGEGEAGTQWERGCDAPGTSLHTMLRLEDIQPSRGFAPSWCGLHAAQQLCPLPARVHLSTHTGQDGTALVLGSSQMPSGEEELALRQCRWDPGVQSSSYVQGLSLG